MLFRSTAGRLRPDSYGSQAPPSVSAAGARLHPRPQPKGGPLPDPYKGQTPTTVEPRSTDPRPLADRNNNHDPVPLLVADSARLHYSLTGCVNGHDSAPLPATGAARSHYSLAASGNGRRPTTCHRPYVADYDNSHGSTPLPFAINSPDLGRPTTRRLQTSPSIHCLLRL